MAKTNRESNVVGRALLSVAIAGCGGRSGISDRIHLTDAEPIAGDAGPLPCDTTLECDDGFLCTGVESCVGSWCVPGTPVECPSDDACMSGICDEASGACVYQITDADEDGHAPIACGGDDCDDARAQVHPGAAEVCDYLDNDCNGTVDDGLAYVGIDPPLDLSAPNDSGRSPDMRFDGQDFDVVFDTWPVSPSQVFYVAVTADGASASDPVQRTFSTVLSSSADLEWNGSEYGLFAHFHLQDVASAGAIALTRLHQDGSPNVNTVEVTDDDPDADAPSAAWNGVAWGVAYVENRPNGTHPIRFMRINADGLLLVSALPLSPGAPVMVRPSVAWTDSGFVIAYVEDARVEVSLVAGASVSWTADVGSSNWTAPALVVADGTLTLAWAQAMDIVRIATLDERGDVSIGPALASDDAGLGAVDLVWTGSEYAVSYQDRTDGTSLVRIGRGMGWVSPPGQVSSGSMRGDAGTTIDFNRTQYGVAYTAGPMDAGGIDFRLAGCP